MRFVRSVFVILVLASSSGVAPAMAYAQQPAEQQGAFVPAESLPQRERMPAAPLLVAFDAVFVTLALWTFEPLMTD